MKHSRIVVFLLITSNNNFSASAFPASNITNKSSLVSVVAASKNTNDVAQAQEIIISTTRASAMAAGATSAKATATTAKATSKSTIVKMKRHNVMRWAMHGVVTELYHNMFLRTFRRLRRHLLAATDDERDMEMRNGRRCRHPPRREIAVVTGATGGIGSQIARYLAIGGYDVVIAARDATKGEDLVMEIRGLMRVTPVMMGTKGSHGNDDDDMPTITFMEYHADVPQSALNAASTVRELGSPLSILINNAGIMGQSKKLTMHVNLLGPAYLTFALLPLMGEESSTRTTPPTVINVGSSAHLRATRVLDEDSLPSSGGNGDGKHSWIDSLPAVTDDDLSTYAQSKLALMQFSTLLRHWLPTSDPPVRIVDAHPGLVWTPLLRNHIGDKAVRILTRTGLANLIYKSSSEGAQAIVASLDSSQLTLAAREQVYFVNGEPGGYASSESASVDAAIQLWKHVLAPEFEGVVDLPKGWGPKGVE